MDISRNPLKNTAQSISHLLMDAYRDVQLMGRVRISAMWVCVCASAFKSELPASLSLGAGNAPVTQFSSQTDWQ